MAMQQHEPPPRGSECIHFASSHRRVSTDASRSNGLSIGRTALMTLLVALIGLAAHADEPNPPKSRSTSSSISATAVSTAAVERGRYLVKISGCNDCHTPGYNERSGRVPVAEWLTGSVVGFRGPWGTSYPSNLRLTVSSLREDEWVTFARVPRLPPMPWFSLEAMSEEDLRAMYRFISSLGPQGVRAPAALPPGEDGTNPYIPFVAQTAKR